MPAWLLRACAWALACGATSIAVCTLHSYANPEHEERIGELVQQLAPDVYTTLSHRILREYREYERTSTTVVNAYVGPRMSGYVNNLAQRLKDIHRDPAPDIIADEVFLPVATVNCEFVVRLLLWRAGEAIDWTKLVRQSRHHGTWLDEMLSELDETRMWELARQPFVLARAGRHALVRALHEVPGRRSVPAIRWHASTRDNCAWPCGATGWASCSPSA